jgi:hypothetical protein
MTVSALHSVFNRGLILSSGELRGGQSRVWTTRLIGQYHEGTDDGELFAVVVSYVVSGSSCGAYGTPFFYYV